MTLSARSTKALDGVHPDMVAVVTRAAELGATFHITEGVRTRERQAALVAAKKSKTMNSRHLTGHAVDFVACTPDGGVTYDAACMKAVADAFKAAAREEGVAIDWGGDWRTFKDTPHFELNRHAYPVGKVFLAKTEDGGECTVSTPSSMITSKTGNVAIGMQLTGATGVGIEVSTAASKLATLGRPPTMTDLVMTMLQSPTFLLSLATLAGGVFNWVDRWKKKRDHGI
jgi:peptidoglycan L-alanyl-D-glutamate endopeptidase CwlK